VNSTVETIDGLIAVSRRTAKYYLVSAIVVGFCAVGLFVVLLMTGQLREVWAKVGNLVLFVLPAPPYLLMITQRQRVDILKVQRCRALGACSDPAELKRIADDTSALLVKLA
jgi:hypothetical protein